MARSFLAHCFALAALGVCIPALLAQDHLLDDLYGRGVHAYFSRNYQDAHKLLSEAATSGSKDPRVFYFRALADNRLQRPDDATADLKTATELEFDGDDPVNVSKALERIQGTERLLIEDARSKARLAIRNAAEEQAKIRYENRGKAEARVLRNPPAAGIGAASPAGGEAPAGAPDKTDPFGAGAPAPLPEAPPAAKPGAAPAKPVAEDPFGEAPAKPATPAVPAKPGTPAVPSVPTTPAKPAADDPFGDAPAKPAAPAAEPAAGETKPALAADPAVPGKLDPDVVLANFVRAITFPIPGLAKGPTPQPPAEEAPIPKGDPNAPDPFGDAPAAKPADPGKAPGDAPPASKEPGAPPAKPGAKAPPEDDPFK